MAGFYRIIHRDCFPVPPLKIQKYAQAEVDGFIAVINSIKGCVLSEVCSASRGINFPSSDVVVNQKSDKQAIPQPERHNERKISPLLAVKCGEIL